MGTELKFVNDTNSNLGSPLPKGTVRIYQNTDDGNALFIGEDRIDHTAKNRIVILNPGNAFDITASREQVDFEQLPVNKPYRSRMRSSVLTTIYNAKKTPQRVRVEEFIPGEWEIVDGQQLDKRQGNTAVWFVDVPAEGETSIRYTVRLKI